MTDTRRSAINRRIRHLLHEPSRGDQHTGSNPLASHLTGPMRRDYRLRRFLLLTPANVPERRSADPA